MVLFFKYFLLPFKKLCYIYYMDANKLGKNIRLLRKQKGWTQIDLAEKLECTQGIITAYENCVKLPSADKIATMAKLFGVSTDELFGREDIKSTKPKSPKLWKKFEQLEKLSQSDKRTVFKMIDGLLAQRHIST